MPCALTDDGVKFSGATGAVVTVKVKSNATTLNSADYNDNSIPVAGNSTTFTIVAGKALLLLDLSGPNDSVEIVEDCGGGGTRHMFGYQDDFHPVLGFKIVGS